jgi:dextranase
MKIKIKTITSTLLLTACLCGCNNNDDSQKDIVKVVVEGVLSTDKARYAPGEAVTFTLDKTPPAGSKVRYLHLGNIVEEQPVSSNTWTWTPPAIDFKGYLAMVYNDAEGTEKTVATVGVDVSGTWTRFPRYGFLSEYPARTPAEINAVIDNLNKYHINGLQYYDWLYDHHKPLAGTVAAPAATWLDLIKRTNTRATTEAYITTAKNRGMASMWYDLCYGALENAAADGVREAWYLFTNSNHTTKDRHTLNSPFRSSIYLTNPSNADWLNYFSQQVADVYAVYDFDGFHIDQLGGRGTLYDYSGNAVNLPAGFTAFINKMKADFPSKKHAFNAVSGYGQEQIAAAVPDFFYNEIWGDQDNYAHLKSIIDLNHTYNPALNCVYAAYMNYDKKSGTFNTPGVLMTDAVIFAVGASHLELGEHMLCSEYFPNTRVQMDNTLKAALVRYYDFLVAYENLLRDGGEFNNIAVSGANLAAWPPKIGNIISLTKSVGAKQVVHLLNFVSATHLKWRDLTGTQAEPRLQKNVALQIASTQPITKVWVATPDREGKMYEEVSFTQDGTGVVTVTVPAVKYWTMVVLE